MFYYMLETFANTSYIVTSHNTYEKVKTIQSNYTDFSRKRMFIDVIVFILFKLIHSELICLVPALIFYQ